MGFEDRTDRRGSAIRRTAIGVLLVVIGALAMLAMVALILSRANGIEAVGCGVLGAWAIVVGSLGYLADVEVTARRT